MLIYSIRPDEKHHLCAVTLKAPMPSEGSMVLRMAAWTPGSYVLREYAGRVRQVSASSKRQALTVQQIAKDAWRIDGPAGADVTVSWEAFAYSHGVHDAYIGDGRLFINPPAVLLFPEGAEKEPAAVKFDMHAAEVHSTLPCRSGAWQARSLEELFDSPFVLTDDYSELAQSWELEACGTEHKIVVTGVPSVDEDRLSEDLRSIFETTIAFWDPEEEQAPFDRYLLQMHLAPGLYGGLEHAAGAVLLETPEIIPSEFDDEAPKDYSDFLFLAAHEYFHAWLVKRLKPAAFLDCSLSREAYTHDLWIFEGFTSYYEGLIALRAGVISEEDYWKHVTKRFNKALGQEGFEEMTLADASFTAWTKLYRPTADSPYSQTSYYNKGALAAFLIDDALQEASDGQISLENVLSDWFLSSRDAIAEGSWKGLPDGGFAEVVLEHSGIDLSDLIRSLSTEPMPRKAWVEKLEAALARQGRRMAPDESVGAAYALAGIQADKKYTDRVVLGHVPAGSPAFEAGLFAGDELVAIDDQRVRPGTLDRLIESRRGMSGFDIEAFRDDRLRWFQIDLMEEPGEEFLCLLPFTIEKL